MISRIRSARNERGGVLVLVAISMVVLLGMAALSVDVGNFMLQKRRLQSAVDFAALAASQDMPDDVTAKATAASVAAANWSNSDDPMTTVATTGCQVAGCSKNDKITVTGTATVPTFFAKVLGFKSQTIKTTAAACGPCDQTTTVVKHDVMVVLDRSYSMCLPTIGSDYSCLNSAYDLRRAIDGIKNGLLPAFDPTYDQVGLVVLAGGAACGTVDYNAFANAIQKGPSGQFPEPSVNGWMNDSAKSNWVVAPLSNTFQQTSGTLQTNLNCLIPNMWTPIAPAIKAAATALAGGRSDAQKLIVFLGDGGANTQPMALTGSNSQASATTNSWYTPTSGNSLEPCQDAMAQAKAAKAAGDEIYVIGYSINDSDSSQACTANNHPGSTSSADQETYVGSNPNLNSNQADKKVYPSVTMKNIASDTAHYKQTADSSQLKAIFAAIGTKISSSGYRLVQ